MSSKKEMFYKNLEAHNLVLSEHQKRQFQDYAFLLKEWNQKMNLTAITESDEIYERHFLDCIMMSYDISIHGSFCDVGSGAGFPSIPLKIVYPELDVWIVEPLQKRCLFLKELVKVLNLDGVLIVNARAEDFVLEKREYFDFTCARAVANLTMLAELCIPLVKLGGVFLAMKGPQAKEEFIQAKGAIRTLGCELEATFEEKLNDMDRVNMVFRKKKHTPNQFPRPFAKIKKSPLKG